MSVLSEDLSMPHNHSPLINDKTLISTIQGAAGAKTGNCTAAGNLLHRAKFNHELWTLVGMRNSNDGPNRLPDNADIAQASEVTGNANIPLLL